MNMIWLVFRLNAFDLILINDNLAAINLVYMSSNDWLVGCIA